jgi:hypothetical protein
MDLKKIANREVLVKIWEEEIEGVQVMITRQTKIRNQSPGEKFYLKGFKEAVPREMILEI